MLSSGVKKNFLPSIWELNSTPSSVTFEIFGLFISFSQQLETHHE
jgi:hypothetical protein